MHKNVGGQEIEEILPFEGESFVQAMGRVLKSPALPSVIRALFPSLAIEVFQKMAAEIRDVNGFQAKVISGTIDALLKQTSGGLTQSGLESLDRNRKYLFVSNHRDIVGDPALFTNCLFKNGYPTPKICLGDNLLTSQWIIDLVKMNKGLTVKRNLPPRDLLRWSHALSGLIRKQIREGIDSVWIAQREGRTKDGHDETQASILKMLALEGEGPVLEKLGELHLVPVAISYEWDPCDAMKAWERFVVERDGAYKKAPGEDVRSMVAGIRGQKGRIHMGVGTEISALLKEFSSLPGKREQLQAVASEIDRQVYANYRLWPSSYIASDLLTGTGRAAEGGRYTEQDRSFFISRMQTQIAALKIRGDERTRVERLFLESYANSLRNSSGSN